REQARVPEQARHEPVHLLDAERAVPVRGKDAEPVERAEGLFAGPSPRELPEAAGQDRGEVRMRRAVSRRLEQRDAVRARGEEAHDGVDVALANGLRERGEGARAGEAVASRERDDGVVDAGRTVDDRARREELAEGRLESHGE